MGEKLIVGGGVIIREDEVICGIVREDIGLALEPAANAKKI